MPAVTTTETETLAAEAKTKREAAEAAKRQHTAGSLPYEDYRQAVQAFASAFDLYHRAKYGKPKRLSLSYLMRSL